MSSYLKSTDFASKDTLLSGDPQKIVKGTEIDDELNAIQTAVNSKADANNTVLTGVPVAPTASTGTNTTQIATTAFVLANAIPAGSVMLFVQTSAPTGWTKSTTHNNKTLRVVSGTAGSGGSVDFTTVFASGLSAGATTLTIDQIPSHSHASGASSATTNYEIATSYAASASTYKGAVNNVNTGTGSTGGGSSHTHTLPSFDVAYVDVIICTKD
jgi:hypothetical protein